MHRRGLGAAGIVKRREREERMNELGNQIHEERTARAKELLETFKVRLTEFAEKHRSRIQKDPEFRDQFVSMCETVGIDPLRSNKSFWADVLGMGNFYTDIAVQVMTIAMTHRRAGGPLLPMRVCLERIQATQCSLNDVRRAIKALGCFGNIKVVKIGNEEFLCTLPSTYGTDAPEILAAFKDKMNLSLEDIAGIMKWPKPRIVHALQTLVKEGFLWIDDHNGVQSFFLLSHWIQV